MKEESEKAGLKLNIQKMKIMVSDPITLWQIDGETMETVTDFIFLGSKELMLLNCGTGEDLRVPWTAKRSNQSILKEITPEYSLKGLMLKLKLQHWPPGVKNGLI